MLFVPWLCLMKNKLKSANSFEFVHILNFCIVPTTPLLYISLNRMDDIDIRDLDFDAEESTPINKDDTFRSADEVNVNQFV